MPTANPSSSSRKRQRMETARASAGPRSVRAVVNWLTDIGATDHWVVSCYLKLEPRDRARGKYLIKVKNRIKAQMHWLETREPDRAARTVVMRDLERVRDHLVEHGPTAGGRGVAIFACEPLGVFEAVTLPTVFRSRLAVDRSPLVRELAAVDDEFGAVLCAVYDRTTARFFRVTVSGAEELPGFAVSDATRGRRFRGPRSPAGGGGSAGEHNYHQRIKVEKHRHYAEIADRLFAIERENGLRGIVLASTGNDAAGVEPHLHPYLARQIIGFTKLNPQEASGAQIMEAVFDVRRTKEREWEADHVAQLTEGLGTGWAVNGVAPTLAALIRGQVRTLLVDPTAEAAGFRCEDTGALVTEPSACGEGAVEPVLDVIDEAIEETLRQGGLVNVLESEGAQSAVDGLGALLRFVDSR